MRKLNLNQQGLSLIDALIGISILAFFVAFLPQVFSQGQKLYTGASRKSDMDRMKQTMLIAAKNVERLKKNIRYTIESQGKSYDEFLNCFGQKGPNQTELLPGTECARKFTTANWQDLKEMPGPGGEEAHLFWNSWGRQGLCTAGDPSCLMNTWAQYYVSCAAERCYSVNLMMGIDPTETMMAMVNLADRGGYSEADFKAQRMPVSFPGSLFGGSDSYVNQICDAENPYMGQLDPQYRMVYCSPMAASSTCGSSVHSLGEGACSPTNFTASDRRAEGTVSPGAIDIAPPEGASAGSNDKVIRVCGRTFGNYPSVPIPNPANPRGPPLMLERPFFNAQAGDQLHLNCAPPLGEKIIRQANGCENFTVAANRFSAPSTIICTFFVTDVNGAVKSGATGRAELQVYDSSQISGGGGPIPTTTLPNPTLTPGGAYDVDSGEI